MGQYVAKCINVPTFTLCLKKVSTFKLSVTLSNVNRYLKFYTAGKRMKFATKPHTTLSTSP